MCHMGGVFSIYWISFCFEIEDGDIVGRGVPPLIRGSGLVSLPNAVAPEHMGPFTQDVLDILH